MHLSVWSSHSEAGSELTGFWKTMTAPSCSASEASPTEASPAFRAQERSFFVRMKSTLTKRGLNVKASGYKVGMNCLFPPVCQLYPGIQGTENRNWETLKAFPGPRDLWVSGGTG